MKIFSLTLLAFSLIGCPDKQEPRGRELKLSHSCNFTVTISSINGENVTFDCKCDKYKWVTESTSYKTMPQPMAGCTQTPSCPADSPVKKCESLCASYGLDHPMHDNLAYPCINGDNITITQDS